MSQKLKIIYIAGSGRSGSTMLSLLLSQHPNVANLGQIRDVFLANSTGEECSCGGPIAECDVWGPILAKAPNESRRLGQLPAHKVLGVYRSANKALDAEIVVDSSKSLDLFDVLSDGPDVDLFCLNLIRDPRAVAASWSKVLRNPDLLRKRCRNWVGRQKRVERFGQMHPDRFLQLRYEDLVRDPVAAVSRIYLRLGLSSDLKAFLDPRTAHIEWGDQHLFAPTNKAVLAARASKISIAEATTWKEPEALQERLLATEICFPFAKRYGYRPEDAL